MALTLLDTPPLATRPLPPGAQATGLLVFDAAPDYAEPLHLRARIPGDLEAMRADGVFVETVRTGDVLNRGRIATGENAEIERALSDVPEFQIVAGPATASGVYRDATEMDADVVLFSPTLPGFRPDLVSELLHFDDRPIASIGLLPPLESRATELLDLGMKGHVSLPLDPAQLRRLLELIPEAVLQARAERASSSYVPLDTPTLHTVAEAGWQRMVIALWGTGGG